MGVDANKMAPQSELERWAMEGQMRLHDALYRRNYGENYRENVTLPPHRVNSDYANYSIAGALKLLEVAEQLGREVISIDGISQGQVVRVDELRRWCDGAK